MTSIRLLLIQLIIKISIMANNIKAENDPQILSGIREFLKLKGTEI